MLWDVSGDALEQLWEGSGRTQRPRNMIIVKTRTRVLAEKTLGQL